jgi:hypothetical protein
MNCLDLLACKWHATYRWKALNECYNFVLDFTSIKGLQKNIMGFQSRDNPNFGNFEIPNLWILGQIEIWVQTIWLNIENTIRGKVMVSPKSKPWWILWVRVCPWLVHAPKVLKLRTNQLVVCFVHIRVNNWLTCHLS